jgi:hypothetical protein
MSLPKFELWQFLTAFFLEHEFGGSSLSGLAERPASNVLNMEKFLVDLRN